jgi:phospholipid transport system substrate-binding protein
MISVRSRFSVPLFLLAATVATPAVILTPMQAMAQALTSDAGQFVQDLGNRAIAQLGSKQIPEEEERTRFRQMLQESFDLNAIGKFTVGRGYWTTASPAQQQEFLSLYETQLTNAYAKRFQDYSGEQFKITGEQKEGDSDTVVSSEITRPNGGPPVPVQWRVRTENGSKKITDVIIAGISMAVTDRQQFSAVIQRGGGDLQALIDALKTQNIVPASTKG